MTGPQVIVLMGVSGSGKTTLGVALSKALGWPFRDGDSFHPPANIAKMSGGVPLTDEDRRPWLEAIGRWIDAQIEAGGFAIVSCSALKRAYREILVHGRRDVRIVYLRGDQSLIAHRLALRKGHFMPPGLLTSQFQTLEPPGGDESVLTVSIDAPVETIVDEAVRQLQPARADSTSPTGHPA